MQLAWDPCALPGARADRATQNQKDPSSLDAALLYAALPESVYEHHLRAYVHQLRTRWPALPPRDALSPIEEIMHHRLVLAMDVGCEPGRGPRSTLLIDHLDDELLRVNPAGFLVRQEPWLGAGFAAVSVAGLLARRTRGSFVAANVMYFTYQMGGYKRFQ